MASDVPFVNDCKEAPDKLRVSRIRDFFATVPVDSVKSPRGDLVGGAAIPGKGQMFL